MKKGIATAVAAIVLAGSTAVFAEGIGQRQWNQQRRIRQGIRSGASRRMGGGAK